MPTTTEEKPAVDLKDVSDEPAPTGNRLPNWIGSRLGLHVEREKPSAQPHRTTSRALPVPGRIASVVVAIVLLSIGFGTGSPNFLQIGNLLDVGRQSSLLALMTLGVTLVLIGGQIDLSIGSIYSLTGVVTAMLIINGRGVVIGVLGALLVGILAGVVNGLLSAYSKLPSFIVTLGTLQVMSSVALLLTQGQDLALYGVNTAFLNVFYYIGQGRPAGIPMELIIVVAVTLVVAIILAKTVFSLRLYATGGNLRAADLAGIPVRRIQLVSFVASGLFAAVAGILNLAFIGSVSPIGGTGMEFDVFAAAVIGGASLFGGQGKAEGALLGALLIGVLRNGLVLLSVDVYWQGVIIGVVTIGAVALNRVLQWRGAGQTDD